MSATIIPNGEERFEANASELLDIDVAFCPRCFILNEDHHVILVCSPRPEDPLNARFMPRAYANRLPGLVDRAVRVLEAACERDHTESKVARLGNLRLNVKPLHGPWGNHTTVLLEAAGTSD